MRTLAEFDVHVPIDPEAEVDADAIARAQAVGIREALQIVDPKRAKGGRVRWFRHWHAVAEAIIGIVSAVLGEQQRRIERLERERATLRAELAALHRKGRRREQATTIQGEAAAGPAQGGGVDGVPVLAAEALYGNRSN